MMRQFELLACVALLVVGSLATSWDDDTRENGASGFANLRGILPDRSPYRKLANELHKVTRSTGLIDNTRAAETVLKHHAEDRLGSPQTSKMSNFNLKFEYLLRTFAQLRDTNERVICDFVGLMNLRHLTEAMNEERESLSISFGAVGRLNGILSKLVARAQSVCPDEFERMWQIVRVPGDISEESERLLSQLDGLPRSIRFFAREQRGGHEEREFIRKLAGILGNKGEWTRDSVAKSLKQRVQVPCEELIKSSETRLTLSIYRDFLVASYNARHLPGMEFDEFYKKLESRPENPQGVQVLDRTFRYGFCFKIMRLSHGEYLINRLLAEGRK